MNVDVYNFNFSIASTINSESNNLLCTQTVLLLINCNRSFPSFIIPFLCVVTVLCLVNLYFLKYCEDPKKTRLSLAWKVCLSVVKSKTFLEDFIRSIHHKEGDGHDDINDEESYYSWNPRLKHVKTIAKQSWSKGC